jgi:signal transduction histidine kinase
VSWPTAAVETRTVDNLVRNAQRHGRRLARLAVSGHDATVRIEVDDAGPGVPAEYRLAIFERFARAPAADGSASGTGLGLALVAEHVRRHGGRVWVTDCPSICPSSSSVTSPAHPASCALGCP